MSHSRPRTIFTSAWLLLFPLSAACGSDDGGGGSSTGGSSTGGSSTGGSSTGGSGTGGSSTGGSAGSGTGGSAGSGTGGSAGSGTGGSSTGGSGTGGSSTGGSGGTGTGGAGTGGASSGNWTCLTAGNGCTCSDSPAYVDKTCAGTYNCCYTYKPGPTSFCTCTTANATTCAAATKASNGTTVSKCPP